MLLLRLLGFWFLIAAVIALVYDATLSLGSSSTLVSTSSLEFWTWLHGASLKSTELAIKGVAPAFVWDSVLLTVLNWPMWLTCALLGVLLYIAGRRRSQIDIFAN